MTVKDMDVNNNFIAMDSASLDYVELGFRVFPCESDGKTPLSAAAPRGCKDSTLYTDQARDWWEQYPTANIGIHAGNDVIIIDLDTKNGKDGVADAEKVTGKPIADLMEGCPCVRTPTGGLHLYYRCPSNVKFKATSGLGETGGIDIRTGNTYVVAPPSRLADGGVYTWINQPVRVRDLPPLPETWEAFIPRADLHATIPATLPTFTPTCDIMDRVYKWLDNAEHAIAGQGGSRLTYKALCGVYHGFALNETQLREAFQYFSATRCNPPWDNPNQFDHKIAEVLASNPPPRGSGYLLEESYIPTIGETYDDCIEGILKDEPENSFTADTDRAYAVSAAIRSMPEDDISLPPVDDSRFKWYRQIREYEGPRVENFPPILWMWAVEVSKNTGCDMGYAAIAAISALSGAAVGGVWVDGGTGFRVPLAVWNAMIGESGCGKSPAFSHVRGLFKKLESEACKKHSKARVKYEEDLERWEESRKDYDNCGTKPPPKPLPPQYVNFTLEDATPEALVKAMEANPRGVFGVNDELSGWLGFGRYGKNGVDGERAFHLSSYDGGEAKVNRAKDPAPIRIGSACAARFGGIQPGILIGSSKKLDAVESGLLPRFGLVWPPDSFRGRSFGDVPEDVQSTMEALIRETASLRPSQWWEAPKDDFISDGGCINEDAAPKPKMLTFDEEATELFKEFEREVQCEAKHLNGCSRSVWSKLHGVTLRYAGLFALAEGKDVISADCFTRACDFSVWLASETCRCHRALGISGGVESTESLQLKEELEFIRENGGMVTATAFQGHFRQYRKSGEAKKRFRELEADGYGRVVEGPRGRTCFILSDIPNKPR